MIYEQQQTHPHVTIGVALFTMGRNFLAEERRVENCVVLFY